MVRHISSLTVLTTVLDFDSSTDKINGYLSTITFSWEDTELEIDHDKEGTFDALNAL